MPIRCPRRLLFLLPLLFLLTICAACGDRSSGQPLPTAPGSIALHGVVNDGPIAGAVVYLLRRADEQIVAACGPGGHARCETRSDPEGRFSFEIRKELVLENLFALSIGGQDRETGVDFTDLEMRSPLELFSGGEALIVISPVTSLLAGPLGTGQTVEEAQRRVREWLALPVAADLAAPPSADLELLRRSLLLTKIAIELKGEELTATPFTLLAEHSGQAVTPLLAADGTLDLSTLTALGLAEAVQQRIVALYQRMASEEGEPLAGIFMQEELVQALTIILQRMLGEAVPSCPHSIENLRTIANRMLVAASPEGIPLGGIIPQRLARYVLFSYGLHTAEPFSLPPAEFALLLEGLSSDPLIPDLAQSKTLYSVAAPLLAEELPGDDNDKRIAYYYGSDQSHLHQAEKLLGLVFDDAINDDLMVKIVKGKTAAGLLAEAHTIITTQIFQSEAKANAWRAYGNVLLKSGRKNEAIEALSSARDLYISVIEAKGKASASSTDTFNLQATAASLRKAGDLDGALQVLDYLAEVARTMSSNTLGRLLVGTWLVADEYIAAGDLAAAGPVVDELDKLAADFPANLVSGVWTYRQRVFYLIETAKRYADLGRRSEVLAIHQYLEGLRAADGFQNFTGAESWAWIPAQVETLYRSGHVQEALALAHSIPESYVDAAGNTKTGLPYQRSAFKQVVTYQALSGNMEAALAMVDTYFTADEDRIEALTYFASNKKGAYIGLALINAGRYAEARLALQRAEVLLTALSRTTDQARYTDLLQRGYLKIADLYMMMGDAEASALLQQAETVIEQFTGVNFIVDGLVELALAHRQLGQPQEGRNLLELAYLWVASVASASKAEDAALLYEALLKAWLIFGDLPQALAASDEFLHWSRAIHLPQLTYLGSGHDDAASKEVDFLLRGGNYLLRAGQRDAALAVLAEAEATAELIYTEAARLGKYIYPKPVANPTRNHIIGGYAKARAYRQALALAISLPYTSNRNDAIHYLANTYAERDDFPATWVASIDSDGDGRPDFFHPLASVQDIAASGLVLDDDCDGDGIADRIDARPLYPDDVSW
jgi:tetratricopeptide (TPR) repeat protein